MTDGIEDQDHGSGLVNRSWRRIVGKDGKPGRKGVLTEEPLTGKEVTASWLDPQSAAVLHARGTVRRNAAGRLVIESWADGVRQESEVPRDANVDAISRR